MVDTFKLQKLMTHNGYLIAIRDSFDKLISNSVLNIIEKNIDNEPVELYIKKRILNVIVECVQSICNVQPTKAITKDSILLLSKIDNGYQIIAGNNIDESKKKRLETFLEELQKMSNEEIKSNRQVLTNELNEFDYEGKEKLSFFELYLRSDRNLQFYFDKLDDNNWSFIVKIDIIIESNGK